jgi:glycerophosphoryl diester phosphodiesterase
MPVPVPTRLLPGTVVAHRGDRTAERENTIAAFVAAGLSGASAVELDVRRTADDELIVHHDPIVYGVGTVVDLSRSDLARRAPWIPTLADALASCEGMWVNVEIKNSPDDPDWDPQRTVAATLTSRIDSQGVVVSSFDWESIEIARNSGLPTAWLVRRDPLAAVARAAAGGHVAINPAVALLEGAAAEETAAAADASGIWVMPWTVNEEAEAIRLQLAGVHAIITDDPARLVTALA